MFIFSLRYCPLCREKCGKSTLLLRYLFYRDDMMEFRKDMLYNQFIINQSKLFMDRIVAEICSGV